VPHNGRDLRELPLFERRAKLKKMIIAANAGWLHYSESFDDGLELLKAADRMRLEVIGVKVKCATWREANKERWRLFERRS
jgi:ATP-dependent DNA ligase